MDFETLKALADQGPLTLEVNGQCMGDALPHGSQVRIEPRRVYWPGDIVVYGRGDGTLVSHRFLGYVRGRTGWLALTRADTAGEADSPVSLSRLVGRLEAVDGNPVQAAAGARAQSALRYLPTVSKLIAKQIFRPASRGST